MPFFDGIAIEETLLFLKKIQPKRGEPPLIMNHEQPLDNVILARAETSFITQKKSTHTRGVLL